jgi:hypothetical protein
MSVPFFNRYTPDDEYNNLDDRFNEARDAGVLYEDYNFTPEQHSLIDPYDIVDDLMELGPVEWKRAKDIPGLLDASGNTHIF